MSGFVFGSNGITGGISKKILFKDGQFFNSFSATSPTIAESKYIFVKTKQIFNYVENGEFVFFKWFSPKGTVNNLGSFPFLYPGEPTQAGGSSNIYFNFANYKNIKYLCGIQASSQINLLHSYPTYIYIEEIFSIQINF